MTGKGFPFLNTGHAAGWRGEHREKEPRVSTQSSLLFQREPEMIGERGGFTALGALEGFELGFGVHAEWPSLAPGWPKFAFCAVSGVLTGRQARFEPHS